tara:strand:+ start:356 stop:823 length:468 start_codon:yes stop_codon:yes gene_type:complete
MRLELYRYSSQKDSTLGMMFLVDKENNKEFLCYTLEDEYRQSKIYGETRIPAKQYYVELRKEGGYNEKYKKRFADIHEGMLHITNVPNFNWILIHCGNTDDNTDGCILVGDTSQQNISKEGFIGNSSDCYKRIYPKILRILKSQKNLIIKIINFE